MKLKEFHSLDKKEYIEVFKDLVGYQEDDIYQHCLNIVDKYDDYWYKTGDLDFYNEKDYIFDAFICFLDYSRGVLRYVFNHFNEVNYKPKSILDYGAGIGFTTAMLASKFKNSKIYYYNIGKFQKEVLLKVKDLFNLDNIEVINDIHLKKYDVCCLLEVLEHFKNPKEVLDDVFKYNSTYLIETNSFTIKSAGHFNEYDFLDKTYSNRQIRKHINRYMKETYQLLLEGYNRRPRIWVNKNSSFLVELNKFELKRF